MYYYYHDVACVELCTKHTHFLAPVWARASLQHDIIYNTFNTYIYIYTFCPYQKIAAPAIWILRLAVLRFIYLFIFV